MTRLGAVLVGAGAMGRNWAETIAARRDVDLVGWVDLVPGRAAAALAELGLEGVRVETSLDAALDATRADFVVDVAAPEAHHALTATCLRRRVPVLGEKPMAASLEEARDLVALSERTGTLFVVSQNRRYNAGLAAFRGVVQEILRDVAQITAEFYRAPHFGGFREEMESPLLVDMAIHTFDAARYVTGQDALSVSCVEFNPSWSWYRGAASAVAEFELSGGAHFIYHGSWCASGNETSWDSSWRAVGANGSALWDGAGPPTATVALSVEESEVSLEAGPAPIPGAGIAGSLADFVRCLRTGQVPMGECHDNIKSLAMVAAAREASRTGRRVRVEA